MIMNFKRGKLQIRVFVVEICFNIKKVKNFVLPSLTAKTVESNIGISGVIRDIGIAEKINQENICRIIENC